MVRTRMKLDYHSQRERQNVMGAGMPVGHAGVSCLTSGRDETGDEIGRPVTGGASGVTGPGGSKSSACDAYGARGSLLSQSQTTAGRFPPSS